MSLITNLLVLYAGILLINVVLSAVLWFRRRGALYGRLCLVWATTSAAFAAQGVAQTGDLPVALGYSFVFFANLTLSQLVGGVVSMRVPTRIPLMSWIASLIAATALAAAECPFWMIALPISITVAAPLLVAASRALLLRWNQLTTAGKALIVSCYFFSLHNLDFPFLRMREGFAPVGFTIALFIAFALSVTAPAAVLEHLAEERVRMENLERLRGRFFSNITHELRSPLTMILAPIEGLLGGELGALSPNQREYLRPIHKNALKLLKLINDLLDLAKIEEQYLRLHVERTDLVDLLNELLAQARPLAARKNISVDVDVRSTSDDLHVDIEKMERVIVNLVSNAFRFTEPGGRVTIWMESNQDAVQIGVRDTGVGIPPTQLERVFERFSQVDDSTTRRSGGTGVGLTLAKEFVELHGGRISVTSEEGQGSEFVVHLRCGTDHLQKEFLERRQVDLKKAAGRRRRADDRGPGEWTQLLIERADFRFLEIDQATDRRAAARVETGPRATKILVVEDNVDVIEFVNLQLSEEHDVYLAGDGKKGLELARREHPDVIVSDYMMPEMDGLSLIRALREDPRTQHIPVIMLTAKSQVQDRIDAREAGAEIYLNKPFSPRELKTAVAQLLDQRGRQLKLAVREQVKSLEVISAGLAHEIHNPLHYIRTSLFVINESVAKILAVAGDPTRQSEVVPLIQASEKKIDRMQGVALKGVERISGIVDLVRRYARDGYPHERTPLCVDQAIRDMAPLYASPRVDDIKVDLDLRAAEALVECIPEELQRAIGILWQNALDALNHGGRVSIRTRVEGESLLVEVEDNGPGIDRERLGSIFVPFFTTKPPGQGLGLGLSIAHRVATETGGTLTVDSVVGRGSTFRLRVPRVSREAREAEPLHVS